MKIPVITINYDRYWKELVVGFGLIRIGGCPCARGLSFWKRLVGLRLRRGGRAFDRERY